MLTIIKRIRSDVRKALLQLKPETQPVIFPQDTPYGHHGIRTQPRTYNAGKDKIFPGQFEAYFITY